MKIVNNRPPEKTGGFIDEVKLKKEVVGLVEENRNHASMKSKKPPVIDRKVAISFFYGSMAGYIIHILMGFV